MLAAFLLGLVMVLAVEHVLPGCLVLLCGVGEQVQCHHRVAGPFVAEPIMDVLAWRTFVLSVLGLLTQSGVDLKAPQGPGQPGYKRS